MGGLFDDEEVRKLLGTPRVPFQDLMVRNDEVEQHSNGYDIPLCLQTYVYKPMLYVFPNYMSNLLHI